MPREIDYDALLKDWPKEYYHVRKAMERKRLLDKSMEKGLDPQGDAMRLKLWECRYPKGKDGKRGDVDLYMKLWMDLNYSKDRLNSKFFRNSMIKTIKDDLETMGIDSIDTEGTIGQKVLYDEFYHMANLYIQLCEEDRNYGTVLLGLGRLNKDSFANKVAKDVATVAYKVPKGLGLEDELKIMTKACADAFYDIYPEYEYSLDEL